MVSMYHYYKHIRREKPKRMKFITNAARKYDFKEWVITKFITQPYAQQKDWSHLNGERFADFVGRYENLQDDFDKVCDMLGVRKQLLPRLSSSIHKPYTE